MSSPSPLAQRMTMGSFPSASCHPVTAHHAIFLITSSSCHPVTAHHHCHYSHSYVFFLMTCRSFPSVSCHLVTAHHRHYFIVITSSPNLTFSHVMSFNVQHFLACSIFSGYLSSRIHTSLSLVHLPCLVIPYPSFPIACPLITSTESSLNHIDTCLPGRYA